MGSARSVDGERRPVVSSSPVVTRLLHDLQTLAAEMQESDPTHLIAWHRVSIDARAILRLVLAESPTLAEANARRGFPATAEISP